MDDLTRTGFNSLKGAESFSHKRNIFSRHTARRSPKQSPRATTRKLESTWNPRFNISYSKDNSNYHKLLREYFDFQKLLDFHEIRMPDLNSHKTPKVRRKVIRISRKVKHQEKAWARVYDPISENNSVVYSRRKKLFS